MSLIIDGHNLIGVLPEIRLGDPDDERQLLQRLRSYRAHSGARPMVVFFDSSDLPAQFPELSSTGIRVHFSAPGQTADDAIVQFLGRQKQPGQYAVVTNDLELSERVKRAGASWIRASAFASHLSYAPSGKTAADPFSAIDPRDPAFVDLYDEFVASEKLRERLDRLPARSTERWIEQLYSGDATAAQAAARWLGLRGGSRALDPLRDALTHGDERVRAAALLALGDLGDHRALDDLCNCLRNDGSSMVRQAAAQSLGHMGDRSVLEQLEASAASDVKGRVRKASRDALAQIRARRD